ncbi:hypothetical protein [Polaribacter sp. OB-PA-B3]
MEWLFGIKYKVWIINTNSKSELYLWENFKTIYPNINSLLEISEKSAYIRTFQSYEYENKWLGFGRMKWNEENNIKWTKKYRNEIDLNRKLQFYSTEIWKPDWNFCCENGKSPNLYFNLYNYENLSYLKEGIIIAIPKKLVKSNLEIIEKNLVEIKKKIKNSTISEKERTWKPSGEFLNNIEDMNPQEMKKIISEKGSA